VIRRLGKTILPPFFLAAACLAVVAGCATSDESKAVTYSLTAKQNYDKGMAELKNESYAEATRYFSFVRQKFPFSKYAVLAELGLADTQFDRGNYQEAIDSYKNFLRLHPTHERVEDGYVAYRICDCYVREMPDDFFLVPPAYEKDQTSVHDALRELNDFIDKYPDSKYLVDARKERREVLRRLIEHEVYVARFYLDRDHPKAAILRLEGALRLYPDSGREPELLVALGETHLRMGQPVEAKQAFEKVVADYSATNQAKRAELFLDFIRRRYGESPQDKAPPHG
jgi:outer membrane protein assembly factor BamD